MARAKQPPKFEIDSCDTPEKLYAFIDNMDNRFGYLKRNVTQDKTTLAKKREEEYNNITVYYRNNPHLF